MSFIKYISYKRYIYIYTYTYIYLYVHTQKISLGSKFMKNKQHRECLLLCLLFVYVFFTEEQEHSYEVFVDRQRIRPMKQSPTQRGRSVS